LDFRLRIADWPISIFDTESFRVLATAVGVVDFKIEFMRVSHRDQAHEENQPGQLHKY